MRVTGAFLAVVACVAEAVCSGLGLPVFRLQETSGSSWTVAYSAPLLRPGTISIGGRQFSLYQPGGDASREGLPQLPSQVLSLGIPFGSTLTAELVNPVFEDMPNQLVAPVPSYRSDNNGMATAEYRPDAAAYAANTWFPSVSISIGTPFTFRQQRVCPVRVRPLQYNPALKTLKRLVRATIVVRLIGPAANQAAAPALATPQKDPSAEGLYRSMVWNYEQAKQWRGRVEPRLSSITADSTRDWFTPGQPYLRLPIGSDGWYRIDARTLAQAGQSWSSLDLQTVKIFQKGKELPVYLDGDSVISFYALRNYGDSTYYDFFTDTNSCWVTWGGGPGLRFAPSSGSLPPGQTVTSSPSTLHLEVNADFYYGTGYVELAQPGPVPGKGWVWDYYYPSSAISHPFTIDYLDPVGGARENLTVRLFSTTVHASTPDHVARIFLNDSLAGEVAFDGRTGVQPSLSVPASWLKTGQNVVKVQSMPTATPVNQFYLDWFEVQTQRPLIAVHDLLKFTASSSHLAGMRFRVQGFSNPGVLLFDLSRRRQIIPDSVVAEAGGTFTAVFTDSVRTQTEYLAVARGAAAAPAGAEMRVFKDLRSGQGADYIVITHRLFKAQADRLAAQRKSTRGVRALVVDVQDIYDEFNFGIEGAAPIKAFLRYAYSSWPGPAPSNVVFMGDASWDPHRWMPTSVMTNFIPTYGVPSSDTWFACFDSTHAFIPSMSIGRLPVKDATEAEKMVSKVVGYDATPRGEWVKKFMFLTAGNTDNEKADFNAKSETMIGTVILPPPVGGIPVRAYKTSPSIVDGSMKPYLQESIKDGVVFLSYLGHSGGRVWGLDPGPPYDFQNTNGWLPFVASVSCNVGAFSEPSGLVLAEDFLLADNRGGIAAWASAGLGYPEQGSLLVQLLLKHMALDSVRAFGDLTTAARIRLWEQLGSDYVTIADQFLTPLLGDPLTDLALPRIPDLALQVSDVETDPPQPTTADSVVAVKVRVRNYGTTPAASPAITMTDTHHGAIHAVGTVQVRQVLSVDSATIAWRPGADPGQHTVQLDIALPSPLLDADPLNNSLSFEKYIYANALQILRPIPGVEIAAGPVRLVAGSQSGAVAAGFTYSFELDTIPSFDSPFKMTSPSVAPGPVSGEWVTPSLQAGRQYYWRTRTLTQSVSGRWVTGSFVTTSNPLPKPRMRWTQGTRRQFNDDYLVGVTPTDSGVGITPALPLLFYCRSLGSRNNADKDFYSIAKVGLDVITGYWWVVGNGFIGVRVDPLDGTYVFQGFNVPGDASQADSMAYFIDQAPAGSYLGFTVVFDGRTNANANLNRAMQSLGARQFTAIQPGMSYALIARKGYSGTTLESLTNDSAVVSTNLQLLYKTGEGDLVSSSIPRPTLWHSFHWNTSVPTAASHVTATILGVRWNGRVDTLALVPSDSTDISLARLNGSLSLYQNYRLSAALRTTDGAVTPLVREWHVDFEPPPDVALGIGSTGNDAVVPRGTQVRIPLTLYNLGYRKADSTRVDVGIFDQTNALRPLMSMKTGPLSPDSTLSVTVPLETGSLSRRVALELTAVADDSSGDLFPGNNSAPYSFMVTGIPQGVVSLYADGVQVMDGDYITGSPKIMIMARSTDVVPAGQTATRLLVDGIPVGGAANELSGLREQAQKSAGDFISPTISNGRHILRGLVLQRGPTGAVDTLQHEVTVNVSSQSRILQVFNYPNPFTERTEFTFMLAGVRSPDRAVIRIYTVAGRKIREIVLPPGQAQIGFNRVAWDGRDNDGDQIANGVYFYQVQAVTGDDSEAVIGKMARAR